MAAPSHSRAPAPPPPPPPPTRGGRAGGARPPPPPPCPLPTRGRGTQEPQRHRTAPRDRQPQGRVPRRRRPHHPRGRYRVAGGAARAHARRGGRVGLRKERHLPRRDGAAA